MARGLSVERVFDGPNAELWWSSWRVLDADGRQVGWVHEHRLFNGQRLEAPTFDVSEVDERGRVVWTSREHRSVPLAVDELAGHLSGS